MKFKLPTLFALFALSISGKTAPNTLLLIFLHLLQSIKIFKLMDLPFYLMENSLSACQVVRSFFVT